MLPAFTLWWREIVRFYRQPTRVVGVLASPLVFWLVIGSGFGTSFRSGGGPGQQHYLDYFYPGALIMIVLFTSIFTMMSVIEDRKEGFLLSVLVAPVPRTAIVLGKVMGGTTLSAVQGMIFLIFAPFAGVHLQLLSVLLVAVVVFLVSFSLTALGFAIAWPMDSSQAFHGIVNLFLIPLVAAVGRAVPSRGRLGMDSHHHAPESSDLRSRSTAWPFVSRRGDQFSAAHGDGNARSVFALHVRTGIADGQPQEHEARRVIAEQYAFFPALNATLNGTSAVLLLTGRGLIARGRIAAHRACMIAAVVASALFLGCYLFFHYKVGNIRFLGEGWVRPVYFAILISHVTLAIVIVPLAIITLTRGLKARYDKHRAIARWTWPLWMYVSITGVIVYFMLYHWFPHS